MTGHQKIVKSWREGKKSITLRGKDFEDIACDGAIIQCATNDDESDGAAEPLKARLKKAPHVVCKECGSQYCFCEDR